MEVFASAYSGMPYSGMPLNRNSALRENPAWIEQQKSAKNRRLTVVCNNTNLVSRSSDQQGRNYGLENVMVGGEHATLLFQFAEQIIYLGHQHDAPIFAVDLGNLEQSNRQQSKRRQSQINKLLADIDPAAEFLDIRKPAPHLLDTDAAISAYALGVCYWHQQNKFCSRCGSPNGVHNGGHMRKCTKPSCAKEVFPRINPAVIMLVELLNADDGIPKCLLGRHKNLPLGVYSTLAGYVEIGETLEEAVAREVMEEAGVKICNTLYIGSQPWPFPESLMLGYRAQTTQQQVNVNFDELEDAAWFSAQEIHQFGEYDNYQTRALPRKDSIARTLIESWLADNQQK